MTVITSVKPTAKLSFSPMIIKDISFSSPSENILFDEALLSLAENGEQGEILRFWESKDLFVVLGRTSKPQEDLHLDLLLKDHIPVLRRASGGGTVLQGQGCLNYSLIISKERHLHLSLIRKSYQFILDKLIDALDGRGIKAVYHPISDMAVGERKFSGNAQKRGKNFILHHGTILYSFPLEKIERYLKIPRDIPEYRRGRGHLDFVMNLPLTQAELKTIIAQAFGVKQREELLNSKERRELDHLLQTKNVIIEDRGHKLAKI